jgi:O-antigen ligase
VKWILMALLLALIPVLTGLLRSQPRFQVHACFALGLAVFFIDPHLGMAPISWTFWTGAVKGIELTLIDSIAVSLLLSSKPVRVPAAIKAAFFIYVAAVVVSTAVAHAFMPASFHAWQLARSTLVFVTMVRVAASNPTAPFALIAGLGTGILIESLVVIRQYLSGANQAGGTLGHQNMLGLASHFATLPAFALLLAKRKPLFMGAIVGAGVIIAFTGSSRATIGLFAIGVAVTIALSLWHASTPRKRAFAASAVVLMLLGSPVMLGALERRAPDQIASSNRQREAFNDAALMIVADHPLGVGGSQYVVTANLGGYLDRAGAAWNYYNRSAPVHNSYLLVAAELGILGLVGMIATLAAILAAGLKQVRRGAKNVSSELAVGITSALIIACAHIAYEWLFMHWMFHYLFALSAGTLIGIVVAGREAKKASRKRRQSGTLSEKQPDRIPIAGALRS